MKSMTQAHTRRPRSVLVSMVLFFGGFSLVLIGAPLGLVWFSWQYAHAKPEQKAYHLAPECRAELPAPGVSSGPANGTSGTVCAHEAVSVVRMWKSGMKSRPFLDLDLARADGTQVRVRLRGPKGSLLWNGLQIGRTLTAQFFAGRIALLSDGEQTVRTWDHPDWKVKKAGWGMVVTGIGALISLLLTPMLFPFFLPRKRGSLPELSEDMAAGVHPPVNPH